MEDDIFVERAEVEWRVNGEDYSGN